MVHEVSYHNVSIWDKILTQEYVVVQEVEANHPTVVGSPGADSPVDSPESEQAAAVVGGEADTVAIVRGAFNIVAVVGGGWCCCCGRSWYGGYAEAEEEVVVVSQMDTEPKEPEIPMLCC